jgi:nucleotide-binding universal stress UspA family protein
MAFIAHRLAETGVWFKILLYSSQNFMNIKSMLLRLQAALGQDNLSDQMLIYPGTQNGRSSEDTGNFVIGYNGSPNSQTALDFILWMAHQTRLATQKQVIVHVVYVIDCYNSLTGTAAPAAPTQGLGLLPVAACQLSSAEKFGYPCSTGTLRQARQGTTQVVERQSAPALDPSLNGPSLATMLEQVDRILWQARCLSNEWRGSVEAHLRFGAVATELQQVVEAQSADLLFVGCSDRQHPLVQQLMPCAPCPILGIPTELEAI